MATESNRTAPSTLDKLALRYVVASIIYFLIGGTLGGVLRTGLVPVSRDFVVPAQFYVAMTDHVITMFYGWEFLAIIGITYYYLPKLLGTNLYSYKLAEAPFWLLNIGIWGALLSSSDALYTFLYPLGFVGSGNVPDLWLVSNVIVSVGMYLFSFNALATFVRGIRGKRYLDVPIMAYFLGPVNIPMFAVGGIAFTHLLATLLVKRWFIPTLQVDPILMKEDFWFLFHPLVYFFIFPSVGALYHFIPPAVKRPLIGIAPSIKFAAPLYVIFSLQVWPHHLLLDPVPLWLKVILGQLTSWGIVIPTAMTFFSIYATMFHARPKIEWTLPVSFLFIGMIGWFYGGMMGPFLAMVAVNPYMHNTQIVPSHFHYIFLGISSMGLFALIYAILSELKLDTILSARLGNFHFWTTSLGGFGMATAMFAAGLEGMRRRVYLDVTPNYETWMAVAFASAVILGVGQYAFGYNIFRTLLAGRRIPKVFGAAGAIAGFLAIYQGLAFVTKPTALASAGVGAMITVAGAAALFVSAMILLTEHEEA